MPGRPAGRRRRRRRPAGGGEDGPALVHPAGDELDERVRRAAEEADEAVRIVRGADERGVEGGHDGRLGEGALERRLTRPEKRSKAEGTGRIRG